MKIFLFLIIVIISACTSKLNNNNFSKNINLTSEMSIETVKNKLKEYAENSTYPNIDD